MNPENSKTFDPRRLFLKLSFKMDLKRSNKYVTLSKNITFFEKTINLKHLGERGMKNLNDLMDYILY